MPKRDDLAANAGAQFERLIGPWQRATALILDHSEQLGRLQLGAMQHYTRIGFRQLREAIEVHDDRSFRGFMERRQQVAEEVSRRMSEDAHAMARIGQEFTEQAQQIAERGVHGLAAATRVAMERGAAAAERTAGAATGDGARRVS